MPDETNASKDKPRPPIADRNHNGRLDGAELIAQLAEEQRPDGLRDYTQAAHGVLDVIGIRRLLGEFNLKADTHALTRGALNEMANELSTRLTIFIDTIRTNHAAARDMRGIYAAQIERIAAEHHEDPGVVNVSLADANRLYALAMTFKETFPHGIHLQGKDMPVILAHFGEVHTPRTPLLHSKPTAEKQK